MPFTEKQKEFNEAMQKYHSKRVYKDVYTFISVANICLEIILLYILTTLSIGWIWVVPIFFIAYFLTDFVNGFVHLYMDHNEKYNSFFGVFIASFHLHHKTLLQKSHTIYVITLNQRQCYFYSE